MSNQSLPSKKVFSFYFSRGKVHSIYKEVIKLNSGKTTKNGDIPINSIKNVDLV